MSIQQEEDFVSSDVEIRAVSQIGKGCLFHRMKTGNPIVIPYDTIRTIDISFKDDSVIIVTDSGNVTTCDEFGDAVESYQRTSDRFKAKVDGKVSFRGDGCVFHRGQNGKPVMIPARSIVSIDVSYHDDSTIICTKSGNIPITESVKDATAIYNRVTA